MRRIIKLNENDLTRIVRRVIRENTDPLQSLIGKTAVFKPTDIDNIEVKDENHRDTWYADELNRDLSKNDKYFWEKFKTKSVKGTITQIKPMRKASVISFDMKIIDGPSYETEIYNIFYKCDSKKFMFSFDELAGNGFFNGKNMNVEYTNNQLSEFLDKNLPCGGFDLSKSGSIDGDKLGNTLS